jgi:hypothetical protein
VTVDCDVKPRFEYSIYIRRRPNGSAASASIRPLRFQLAQRFEDFGRSFFLELCEFGPVSPQ